MPKLHLITYGCQMNEYDSERVAGLLKRERYELTEVAEEADLILLNTCAIREKAEDKVFSRLGQLRTLKQQRPEVLIGVMGCMAQLWQGKILERAPQVDLVFGSAAVARVGELVEQARAASAPIVEVREAPLVKLTAKPERPGQLKAFVTVMEGCEKFCTFCVVPVTRGRERSHPPEAVVAEVRELAAAGVREVTLLGQTVNAYGRDLTPATDLAALLELIDEVDGIERIRFTTSNPYNLTARLIRAIRDVPKVVEYLHLPLQSGSDRVLERMNRGYTAARYLELIAELTETVPGIALSTDLIVGFPGETDAGLRADGRRRRARPVRQCLRLPLLAAARHGRRRHERPGAGRRQGAAERAHTRGRDPRRRRAQPGARGPGAARCSWTGAPARTQARLTGRTRCNRVVNFDAHGRDLLGTVVPVLITRALPHSLRGELAGAPGVTEGRVLAAAV